MNTFAEKNPGLIALLDTLHGPIQEMNDVMRRDLDNAYARLMTPLPHSHPWKSEMHEISSRMRDGITNAAELDLNPTRLRLLGLLAYTHGLGRLVEANRALKGEARPPWNHGRDAAQTFSESVFGKDAIAAKALEHPFWRAALYAIEHRPDPTTPAKDAYPDAEHRDGAHALLGLLRDAIKRDGLLPIRVGKNLTDEETKRAVRKATYAANLLEQDPDYGTERGYITPSQLDRFCEHKALVRADCATYETLMLQIIAYLFDVMHEQFASIIIDEGGPGLVYRYLAQRIPRAELARVRDSLMRWNATFGERICG